MRFQNSKETFLAGQSVKKDIDKKPEEFRDRKLTDFSNAQARKVVLRTPAGEIELEKKDTHWEILKPLRARADDQKVNDLISQVTSARIGEFVADDGGDLRPYGLAEPRGSITLFDQEQKKDQKVEIGESIKVPGREDKGQTLQIGGIPEKEKEQVYVRFAPRGSVYTLPKKLEEILNTKPADLRDNHLVPIDTNILDRITIDAPGKTKTVLARKDGNWTIANKKNALANSGAVQRMEQNFNHAHSDGTRSRRHAIADDNGNGDDRQRRKTGDPADCKIGHGIGRQNNQRSFASGTAPSHLS